VKTAFRATSAIGQFDGLAIASAALLFLALMFGGGGADAPINAGVLAALASLLLTAHIAAHFADRPLPAQAIGPLWFLVAALALIGVQLIPLPPALWSQLPGRETAAAVSAVSGSPDGWRPLSLDPEATRRHAAALLLPAALLLAGLGSNYRGLILLARTIVAAALISALLGAVQVALDSPPALSPYGPPVRGVAVGVFTNSNHQAQLMLAALITTGLLIRIEAPQLRIRTKRGGFVAHFGWLLFPIFIIVAVGADSRAALLLLLPAVAAAALIATKRKGTARLLLLLFVVLASIAAILVILPPDLVRSMQLQTMFTEVRVVLLPDLLFTLGQYWPWGSGLGTFIPVFEANQNLNMLQPFRVNHAHNDPLELLIETGLAGALLLGAALTGICWRLVQLARRTGSSDPGPALAGFAILALMLVHSLVDYPLRQPALGAVAAIAVALLFSPAQQRPLDAGPTPAGRRRKGFGRPFLPPSAATAQRATGDDR